MPRRFAVILFLLLVLLLAALLAARAIRSRVPAARGPAQPTMRPTPAVPPTPIPARRVTLYFEGPGDGRLHPEDRDVPAQSDDVALLRSVASAVLEGPRHETLLRPFPDGWRVRSAFKLGSGMAVIDLGTQEEASPDATPAAAPPAGEARWEAGAHEEVLAAQALVIAAVKALPGIERVVLLVNGEPVETLGGHLDLGHPLHPDLNLAVDEPPLPALPPPTPTATATPPPATPSPAVTAPTAPTAPPRPLPRRTPRPPASPAAPTA